MSTVVPAPEAALSPRLGSRVATSWQFCKREKLWLACMLAFVLTWTIELFVVQEITLVYPNGTSARYAFWAEKIRFGLDLLFIGTLSLALRRRWLFPAIVVAFVAHLGLMTYFDYFKKPLSLTTMLSSINEGKEVSALGIELLPQGVLLVLGLTLLAKLGLLLLAGKSPLPRKVAWGAAAVLFSGYVSIYAVANYIDPLHFIRNSRGVGRVGEIRGYLGPWFAEWYYLHDGALLERALQERKTVYDRLTPLEADIPIHNRLVFLQCESFDTNILGYKVNGEEVTPFLNRLRDQAMYYRVEAVHYNGSADADFAVLNAVVGSKHENTYSIAGYPYENTTPELLARSGFKTFSFHGNTGEFYNRRRAFEKMGFSGIHFREELEAQYGCRAERWGIADKDVLTTAAQLLRTSREPTCHVVISLTTHAPFTLLAPHEMELYKEPRTFGELYVNNMRYLDNCVRDYITSLGKGVTVMLYSDHPTKEGKEGFQPDRANGREFIPVYIYDSDRDLSQAQKTRENPIATDGTLNLVDVVNYMRNQITRSFKDQQPAFAPTAEPTPEHAQFEGS